LLQQFNGSAALAIMYVYKEYAWKPWKFERTPHGWWSELAAWSAAGDLSALTAMREYILDLASELNITTLDDWNAITTEILGPTHSHHLKYLGELPRVLKRLYPDHQWQFEIAEEKRTIAFVGGGRFGMLTDMVPFA